MSKEEMKARFEKLNEKMKDLGAKVKDSAETVAIVGLEAKDKLDDAMLETKSSINALKENYRIYSEKAKGKASSELLKAQMNIEKAREDLKEKKDIHDKEKFEKYIEDTIEYAEAATMLSVLAAKEAELARLEAIDAKKQYDEKYGK